MRNTQEIRLLILKLLKDQGSNTSKMLTELDYNQSLLHDMGKHNRMPAADKIARIAEYLHVSVDYLMGLTENPEVNK